MPSYSPTSFYIKRRFTTRRDTRLNILKNTALDLHVRKPDRVTTAIKESKYISEQPGGLHRVLVKWTLDNVRRLANMGFGSGDMPSPMEKHYDWPGIFNPFKHQRHTAGFLTVNDRCYCFDEQGLGKTASVIWASDYLMRIGDIERVLIICPLSIMRSAWANDIFNIVMHRSVTVAHGSRTKREALLAIPTDYTIINYDGIAVVKDTLKNNAYDLIVMDEATAVKTATTTRWKKINSLLTPSTKVWMLTGTPAAQSPLDAYGLAKMNTPHRVPKYFGPWRDKVMFRITQFKWIPKRNATSIVHAALQPAIRHTKAECLDLPTVTYQTREVPLTAQQQKYYKMLKQQMRMEVAGTRITAVHAAAGIQKLLQISTGTVYNDDGDVVAFDGSNRLRVMMEIIQDTEHKVIVFAPYRHTIAKIREHIMTCGYSADVINGAVSFNKRTKIINDFQTAEHPHVLIIQPQSAAHGVTLTAAATIIWFGPTNSVETWLQANERINRPSQENKMNIVKIIGSQVERKVYNVLEDKDEDQKSLVALYEAELSET